MKTSSNIEKIVVPELIEEMATRSNGAIVRESALRLIASGYVVMIDLQSNRVTPSFADEVFGKLCLELGFDNFKDTVGIENYDERDRSLIRHVVLKRADEAKRVA